MFRGRGDPMNPPICYVAFSSLNVGASLYGARNSYSTNPPFFYTFYCMQHIQLHLGIEVVESVAPQRVLWPVKSFANK